MDLSSMLNSGPPTHDQKAVAPSGPLRDSGGPTPGPMSNGQDHRARGSYAASTHPIPSYGPPPSATAQQRGLAPLQTHAPSGTGLQHPFQQQQQLPQSPAPLQPAHQRPYEPYAVTTPGARPSSHGGYPYTHHSPSQFAPSLLPSLQHSSSHSPTPPPSMHGQTPHSVRQSPLSLIPGQVPPPPQPVYHPSQPSTPLGPPSVHYQRTSNHGSHHDIHSPYHSRTLSGASSGMNTGSPAQHRPSIGNLVDSPSILNRQSPLVVRRTSEYLNHMDRERSLSVSPKTQVLSRPLSSHRSGELHSARSSAQPGVPPPAEALGHVRTGSNHHGVAPVPEPDPAVGHKIPQHSRAQPPRVGNRPLVTTSDPTPTSLSAAGGAPAIQHHHALKMGMTHLLTPTSEVTPTLTGYDSLRSSAHLAMQPPSATTPNKRSAEDMEQESPVRLEGRSSKKAKRKYDAPPVWARLHPSNPRSRGQKTVSPPEPQSNGTGGVPAPSPASYRPPQNGTDSGVGIPPWQQDPPLDMELIQARLAINGPWEKSFKWNQPYLELHSQVLEFLQSQLEGLNDVGNTPAEGDIEIEAKFGHIIVKASDQRIQLPVKNACVLDSVWCEQQTRFESRMDQAKHRMMNEYLNARTQESYNPGRIAMRHSHPKEIDAFRTLSPIGIQALPLAFQRRGLGREPRLRTTTDSKTGQITARIVKISLGSLHIFNPNFDYDCRISVNLEVNLDRPDLHPDELIVDPTGAKPAAPDRKKDRLSYKHLAYSIDLTRVDTPGVDQPKYELELEVDGGLLRHHIRQRDLGQRNAVTDIVSGFVDNATFLMRGAT